MHISNVHAKHRNNIFEQECTHREQTSADPDNPDFGLWVKFRVKVRVRTDVSRDWSVGRPMWPYTSLVQFILQK